MIFRNQDERDRVFSRIGLLLGHLELLCNDPFSILSVNFSGERSCATFTRFHGSNRLMSVHYTISLYELLEENMRLAFLEELAGYITKRWEVDLCLV